MLSKAPIKPHAFLTFPIDELSLGSATGRHGLEIELCAYAFGEAEIAFDRNGDWQVDEIRIDGHGSDGRKSVAVLSAEHPLRPLILGSLIAFHEQQIDDAVQEALQQERAAA